MRAGLTLRVLFALVATGGALALSPIAHSSPPQPGDALPGLTADQAARFDAGKDEFTGAETIAEGLGPVFNDSACANCHSAPAVGGGSHLVETRFGTLKPDGTFDPLSQYGGSLIQTNGIGPSLGCEYVGELVPPQATIVAGRRTTPLFGLGLVDAVPDGVFRLVAALEKLNPDGTAGIVSHVTDPSTGNTAVGKFGWKCQNPSLFVFAGDAYLNEMGITNPLFPDESCPQGDCESLSCNPAASLNDDGHGVQAFTDFMTFLAPPPRGPITGLALLGELQFNAIGCASCHRATFQTGPNAVAVLDRVVFHPYSDFLLHDMGSLGDGITQNEATGRLMRTAPLWGARFLTTFLHDGRATTFEQAIAAHEGQGRKARDRFQRLSSFEKAQLIAFLKSL